MHRAAWSLIVLAMIALPLAAGDTENQDEYQSFSRLVHKLAVKQLPREFVDASGWGQTIPVPAKLPLANLRTYVKVGDKLELPHGAWRRFTGKIEDPDKNLKIKVKDFKKLDDKTYRIVLDVDALVFCQAEWEQWQKGLLLVGAGGDADVHMTAAIVCDVGVSLDTRTFPPGLKLEPKVTELGLNLVDINLRGGPLLKGEKGDGLRNDLKDLLRSVVKSSEPFVKEQANLLITQSIREGKGSISATEIMKALPMPKK